MTTTREYPIERLEAERQAGLMLCRCDEPQREYLALWDVTQCGRCGYKVVEP